jgi:hypothetical protein
MKLMIHTHTTYSADGELTPGELARLAHEKGFDAVMVSDHFESLTEPAFQNLVDDCSQIHECLMVPGYERSFRGYHILALGITHWFDDRNIQSWADNVRSVGGIVGVAHPTRYGHSIPDDILNACDAVEVWNSKFAYDGEVGPDPRAYPLLGGHRFPLCSQDLHGVRHASTVGVELRKGCGNGAEIIECLKARNYQMTNGILRFDSTLSPVSAGILGLFHVSRKRAVKSAIRLRRLLRSAA